MKNYLLLITFLVSAFLASAQQKTEEAKENKKIKLAAVPIPTYNKTFGFGLGLMANAYYRLEATDTISPKSSTGMFGYYTENKTWIGAFWQSLYWGEDKNRATVLYAMGKVNAQTYFDFLPIGFVEYASDFNIIYADYMRNVFSELYLGPSISLSQLSTDFTDIPIPTPLATTRQYNAMGIHSQWDSRNNIFYPVKGINPELRYMYFNYLMNSESEFSNVTLSVSQYQKIGEKSVLASNAQMLLAIGEHIPFEQQNVVGGRVLRGYTNGKYRNNQVYCIQTEYRWNFWRRFGATAFCGAAWNGPSFAELGEDGILPAFGLGIRWNMIEEDHINIGLDYAWGKGDGGFYFRITEAF